MPSLRDDGWYHARARRKPPESESNNGFFRPEQGLRPVLPPLLPPPQTSRSPAPTQHSNQYSQQKSSSGHNQFNVALYTPLQHRSSSFPHHEHYDPRYGAAQYPATRASPSLPNDPYDSSRLSMLSSARHEEDWSILSFPSHSDDIRSPKISYSSQYAPHHMPQQAPHVYPETTSDNQNTRPPATYNQYSQMPVVPQSLAEQVVVSHGKEAHLYARSSATPQSTGYAKTVTTLTEDPIIKKRRPNATPAQLKVLNKTYRRTAFPSTKERLALAAELKISSRSVQIWFQNKRQTDRRLSAATAGIPVPSRPRPTEIIPTVVHTIKKGTCQWEHYLI